MSYEVKTEVYKNYLIKILYDEDAESPRKWDNICIMNCYHRRYVLGDNECKGDAYEDLRKIITDNISPNEFIKLSKDCKSIRITHNNKSYYLYEYYDGKRYLEGEYPMNEKYSMDALFGHAVEIMSDRELFDIIDNSSNVAISHIYGYDHGGLSISMSRTGVYADRFDSGCLGFIYVTKEQILKAFKDVSESSWEEKAFEVIASEVSVYNSYLTGECYGWKVYAPTEFDKDDPDEPTEWNDFRDSCWGYIGDSEIEYMISEAKGIIDDCVVRDEEAKKKAEEELARRRKMVAENLENFVGQKYIAGGNFYTVNRDNLLQYPQVSIHDVKNGCVETWGKPLNVDSLPESLINTIIDSYEVH